ncbi:MAG: retroviral-like aspartic protease family protein [Candidatus Bathyarchaeia archaeon]
MSVRGERGEVKLENVLVDTGATYTVLPEKLLWDIGAVKIPPYKAPLELGDGRKVEAKVYAAAIKVGEREGPGVILAFKDSKSVLGVQALEALGLRVDPTTGELEATRPKGIAYFY